MIVCTLVLAACGGADVGGSAASLPAAPAEHVVSVAAVAGGTAAPSSAIRAQATDSLAGVTIGASSVAATTTAASPMPLVGPIVASGAPAASGAAVDADGTAWRLAAGPTSSATAAPVAEAGPGVFVDAELGNDANPGTQERPWRTLQRVAQVRLRANETIYLRCGRTWRETLTLTSANLPEGGRVAGYGSECGRAKAVVSGADRFAGGWVNDGVRWSRALSPGTPKITQLFVNGIALRTAQWPNADAALAATVDEAATPDAARFLPRAADRTSLAGRDLRGARVQLRTQPWWIEEARIASQDTDGGLRLEKAARFAAPAGASFVLQDQAWMLDARGEFFHDTAANRLIFLLPAELAAVDVNGAVVEGSVRDAAVDVANVPRLTMENVAAVGSRGTGMSVVNSPRAVLRQVEASDNGGTGLLVAQWVPLATPLEGPGVVVTDSRFDRNQRMGIHAGHVDRAEITNNIVTRTGTEAWVGGTDAAIQSGVSAVVRRNVVDGTAYQAIGFSGTGGSQVVQNLVTRYCQRMSDCGAIYSWNGPSADRKTQNQTSLLEGNTIGAAQAAAEGTRGPSRDLVAGIYLDDFVRGVTVRSNTLYGMPIGVFLNNASYSTVESNRIWLPTATGIQANMGQITGQDELVGNAFRNNAVLVAQAASGIWPGVPEMRSVHWLRLWHRTLGAVALQTGNNVFSGNRVAELTRASAALVRVTGPQGDQGLTSEQWQRLFPTELAWTRSRLFSPWQLELGPQLVPDGGFEQSGSWGSFTAAGGGGATSVETAASLRSRYSTAGAAAGMCAANCMLLRSGSRGDLLGSGTFQLTAGRPHVYEYRAGLMTAATIGLSYISRAATPWDAMAEPNSFRGHDTRTGEAGTTLEFQAFFVPKERTPSRVNLQLDTVGASVAFDAVSVREVLGYSTGLQSDWSRLVIGDGATQGVTCASLGWPANCRAMRSDGSPVTLPMTLPSGQLELLLRADSPFRLNP